MQKSKYTEEQIAFALSAPALTQAPAPYRTGNVGRRSGLPEGQ